MNKQLQFKLILVGSIATLLTLLIVFVFLQNRSKSRLQKTGFQQPTVSIFKKGARPKLLTPTPVVVEEFATGVLSDEFQKLEEEYPDADNITALIQDAPIENESFRIEYSYADLKFLVQIKPPYAVGRAAFLDFLEKRGLISVEEELFIVSYK